MNRPPAGPEAVRLGAFVRSFWLPPALHRNFYRVLVTRLFANLGVWSVLTFLLFYLQRYRRRAEPGRVLPMLLGIGACSGYRRALSPPGSTSRYGIVAVVRATSWMMAGAASAYVLIALHPQWLLMGLVASRLFPGLGRLPGGRLGLGVEGAAAERDVRQGYGHLACRAGACRKSSGRVDDRLDHQRRQMGGLRAFCLCAGVRDRGALVQPLRVIGGARAPAAARPIIPQPGPRPPALPARAAFP